MTAVTSILDIRKTISEKDQGCKNIKATTFSKEIGRMIRNMDMV